MRSKNNKEAIIFEHDHILLAINFIKLKKKNAHRKSIKKFANLYNNISKLDQLDEKEFKQFKHPFIVLSFFISNNLFNTLQKIRSTRVIKIKNEIKILSIRFN